MKARLCFALIALLAVTAFAPAPFPKPPRRLDRNDISLPAFQGLWRVEGFGRTSSTGNPEKRDWHIKFIRVRGEQWNFMNSATSPNAGYYIAIDGRCQPAALDFFNHPPRVGKDRPTGVGIIRRQGDKVTIIYSFSGTDERAVSFERPPDGQWVIWLERVR